MATGVRDIGIAVIEQGGSGFPNVGPLVVTEDYDASSDRTAPQIGGVAFQDTAGTGTYLPGEELPGITVTVGGATTTTLSAGGFQMPRRQVTFRSPSPAAPGPIRWASPSASTPRT